MCVDGIKSIILGAVFIVLLGLTFESYEGQGQTNIQGPQRLLGLKSFWGEGREAQEECGLI